MLQIVTVVRINRIDETVLLWRLHDRTEDAARLISTAMARPTVADEHMTHTLLATRAELLKLRLHWNVGLIKGSLGFLLR
jgi:hypothetical protein